MNDRANLTPPWASTSRLSLSPAVTWTRREDILFEGRLLQFPEETLDRWGKIAEFLPGKTPEDCRQHYEDLVYDLEMIESGKVPLPHYPDDDDYPPPQVGSPPPVPMMVAPISSATKSFATTHAAYERKKGTPWTAEEHRKFLEGLHIYGKGDWRSISRNVVITRTPTQVASHAQKYYLRLATEKEKRKRSSIHDIINPLDAHAHAPTVPTFTNPDSFPSYYSG